MLAENNLTERHARALLRLPDDRQRQKTIKLIVERGFNVAKTEELVDKLLKASAESRLAARKNHDGGRVFKDVRIFNNTIRQAVDMMRRSGIEAKANKKESDDYIEYTILIPKEAALSESNT